MSDDKLIYEPVEGEIGELLDKYHKTVIRKGYVRCKNCILPERFKEIGDTIKNMEIRDDDTWVCAFPKSGTTWTQEMVWCIKNDLDFEGSKATLDDRFPLIEMWAVFDFMADDPPQLYSESVMDSLNYVLNMPSPRFVKTHLPFNLLPEKLQSGCTKAKIIYSYRNPRDACISHFHHSVRVREFHHNFDIYCHTFLKDAVMYGPYWNHIFSYWDHRDDENVLLIRFEDMKRNLRGVIQTVCKFVGKRLTDDQIEQLADHLKFENMKKNEAINFKVAEEAKKGEDGNFVRRGQIGEWKQVFTPEVVALFEKWEQKGIAGSNFEIPS